MNKCSICQSKEPSHQCPLFPDCPCCEDTIDRINNTETEIHDYITENPPDVNE